VHEYVSELTQHLRLNYFAVANAGSLQAKVKTKFVNYKVKIVRFWVENLLSLIITLKSICQWWWREWILNPQWNISCIKCCLLRKLYMDTTQLHRLAALYLT